MLDHALYQSIFSSGPIGAYILSPSADRIILDVNEAFLRNVGHTRDQLVDRCLFEAFPADSNDPLETGVAALGASLARVIATGLSQSMPTQRYPIRTVGEDTLVCRSGNGPYDLDCRHRIRISQVER